MVEQNFGKGTGMKIMVEMSEEEICRAYLARSGMVAVERGLMNELAALENGGKHLAEFNIVYHDGLDHYGVLEQAAVVKGGGS